MTLFFLALIGGLSAGFVSGAAWVAYRIKPTVLYLNLDPEVTARVVKQAVHEAVEEMDPPEEPWR